MGATFLKAAHGSCLFCLLRHAPGPVVTGQLLAVTGQPLSFTRPPLAVTIHFVGYPPTAYQVRGIPLGLLTAHSDHSAAGSRHAGRHAP